MYALWMLTSLADMSHNNNIIETGNSIPLLYTSPKNIMISLPPSVFYFPGSAVGGDAGSVQIAP
jgi:hypothetical protein